MSFSNYDYQQMLARLNRQNNGERIGCEDESELHRQIIDECARRGWLVFHGPMAHRTYRVPGEPDFIILADGGEKLLIEAKTRKGKLSTDQLGIQAWARKLGHEIKVVRSIGEFLEALSVKEAA